MFKKYVNDFQNINVALNKHKPQEARFASRNAKSRRKTFIRSDEDNFKVFPTEYKKCIISAVVLDYRDFTAFARFGEEILLDLAVHFPSALAAKDYNRLQAPENNNVVKLTSGYFLL